MRSFTDQAGRGWIATAREEETTRHHGRWHLHFHADTAAATPELAIPEIRWQNRETAQRTILTMSDKELRRRLEIALARLPRTSLLAAS
jgi:hypothetical protein